MYQELSLVALVYLLLGLAVHQLTHPPTDDHDLRDLGSILTWPVGLVKWKLTSSRYEPSRQQGAVNTVLGIAAGIPTFMTVYANPQNRGWTFTVCGMVLVWALLCAWDVVYDAPHTMEPSDTAMPWPPMLVLIISGAAVIMTFSSNWVTTPTPVVIGWVVGLVMIAIGYAGMRSRMTYGRP